MISVKLILIDEIFMAYKHSLNAIDKCLQDLMDNKQPFGGKTVVIGGDFR